MLFDVCPFQSMIQKKCPKVFKHEIILILYLDSYWMRKIWNKCSVYFWSDYNDSLFTKQRIILTYNHLQMYANIFLQFEINGQRSRLTSSIFFPSFSISYGKMINAHFFNYQWLILKDIYKRHWWKITTHISFHDRKCW